MVTLKPFSCGLRWVGAQALCWLWAHHSPVGVSPSLHCKHVLGDEFSEVQPQQAHVLLLVYSRGFPGTFRRLKASRNVLAL